MQYIFLVIIGLLSIGCTTKVAPITNYTIAYTTRSANNSPVVYPDTTIKVAQTQSSALLVSTKMRYMQGAYKGYTYNNSAWMIAPADGVYRAIVTKLQNARIFKQVATRYSKVLPDVVLQSSVEEFMQHYDNELQHSYARVSITFELIKSDSLRVIGTKTFTKEVKVHSLDAQGGVEALNKALEDILDEMVVWLKKQNRL